MTGTEFLLIYSIGVFLGIWLGFAIGIHFPLKRKVKNEEI